MAVELVPNEAANGHDHDHLCYFVVVDGQRVFEHTVAVFDPFDHTMSVEIAKQQVLIAYLEAMLALDPGQTGQTG